MPTYEERIALRKCRRLQGHRRCHGSPALWIAARYSTRWALIGSTPAVNTRSVMQVAYRWIRDAGFEVEYVIPDGITDVPKSQRTGCYADDLPAIVAYKDAWYLPP